MREPASNDQNRAKYRMIEMTEYAETTVYSDFDMTLSLVEPFFIWSDDVTTSFVHARKTNIPED